MEMTSDANECHVCKGEVTIKTLSPIFGCGIVIHKPEEDYDFKIPTREANGSRGTIERIDSMLKKILTSHKFRGEQNAVVPLDHVHLTHSSTLCIDVMSSQIHSLYLQRQSY
ncbi:hypothetical protein V6N13_073875 [Hibiscus sabdariffa]|uniref:Uncharacterized protein n=1 Tax=Hibiscus sabdariffa TaxID=183260 RepID=A0ABR2BYN0_9ROSI